MIKPYDDMEAYYSLFDLNKSMVTKFYDSHNGRNKFKLYGDIYDNLLEDLDNYIGVILNDLKKDGF